MIESSRTISAAKEQCSGCGACAAVCPREAICFHSDEEGFRYPQIMEHLCVKCGKCRSICPFLSKLHADAEKPYPQVYAAWSRNEHLRKSGSSGGLFGTFAQEMISQGGVVFGACYDDDLILRQTEVKTLDDLPKLYTSKYVQSDENGTFRKVLNLREKNIPVLYCGTPCQIAGLRKILGKSSDRVILVDFVCHGVPAPEYLSCYKRFLENRYNAKLLDLKMRITDGWGYGEIRTFQSKISGRKWISTISDAAISPYLQPFFHCENYRYSCYRCPFACLERPGDITLCDFWGAEEFLNFSQRNSGVSGIMINNSKGKSFFDRIADRITFFPQAVETLAKKNENLKYPAKCPTSRAGFYQRWQNGSPDQILRSYYSSRQWYLLQLKNIVRKAVYKLGLNQTVHKMISGK